MGVVCHKSHLLSDAYLKALYNKKSFGAINIVRLFVKRCFKFFFVKHYDIIVIEKELFPFLPPVFEFILVILKVPFILDYDDAIFHQYDMHKSFLIRFILGGKIKKIMSWSSAVITGSPYLTEFARRYADHVVEIPTVIDLNKYILQKIVKQDIFTIGWIGSPTSSRYLIKILPALEKFYNNFICRIKLVGFDCGVLPSSLNIPIEIVPWSEEGETSQIQSFHVGIMPLDDSPWSQGKCGFKLIQYMACKLPVIASPVGANLNIIQDNVNGFLASDVDEWYNALSVLYNNTNLRKKIGEINREKVEKIYSLQVTFHTYLQVLKANLPI